MLQLHYGGSFNPVHHAHLICARAAAEAGGYGRVVLVPSHQPPHKPGDTSLASAADRLTLCRLAVATDPLFDVDDLELNRTGPSYTIDTAQELKRRGASEVHWLIGADMLQLLPRWHRAEELVHQVHFVIMARPGWSFEWDALPAAFRHLQSHVVPSPLIDISATQIRQRVREGRSIAYLTPDPVRQYIERKGLYRP